MDPIRVGDLILGDEEREAIGKIIDSGRISEGPFVRRFEREWAKYVGTRECVLLNSGTSALIAGIAALKVGEYIDGTRVVTTPLTYVATSNAIILNGLEPVYVDVDPETFIITPQTVSALLEEEDDPSSFAMLLPVHLMGYPCDMDGMDAVVKKYGLVTFEDSAQAHGSRYKGKRTGSLSLLSDFSFYIAHNIQAGELGALVTDDPNIARLVRKIKANGRVCDCSVCVRSTGECPHLRDEDDPDPRFTHDLIGYNFKTMEFQAAIALCQLQKADWILERRQENVRRLNEALEPLADVLATPPFSPDVSYLAYTLVIKDPKRFPRARICREMEHAGIETRPLFGCIPTQQPAYASYRDRYKGRLPVAERLGSDAFYVGCHQYLSEEQLDHMASTLRKVFR
ncbi:MAG: DegT/DnrJ/EryC1/StrS family aminotransferase [Candidatus Undinarchaeales archaeon]|jgi:dTDP-4-amino-4,6-dideoxygalactose transaminase|nr:DegT/DnrJ/EryC1/StrS family aminotransferase [Candidatus Undinarchaeales archaeon]MDP7493777.1 DegT/DnrJ/EryC1/StrS family aminotransferase [Candidatus Undinarchaeales archaeon]